ncbi:MAG: alpha/beta fold hydrolase [Myxococcales bacterium]|nr:alpha/beta fold hydrolase [Myxococcales bacterium]MDD9964985.1 alpha/beta fold hydrolase [Myxococcales bacterium]
MSDTFRPFLSQAPLAAQEGSGLLLPIGRARAWIKAAVQAQTPAKSASCANPRRSGNETPEVPALAAATGHTSHLGLRVRTVQLRGRVAYVDEGSGPVVLLLHGAPMTSLGFVRVIRELRKHHRVIAPDMPGFGGSECPPGFGGSLSEYAHFVQEFCRALDLRALVVYVNDASGPFGIAASAGMAGRLAGLVVADTVQIPLTGWAWVVRQVLVHVIASRFVRFINRRFNLLPRMVAKVAPFMNPLPVEQSDELVRQFDTPAKRDRIVDVFEQMGRDVSFMRRTREAVAVHLAQVPTLILYGQFDPMRIIGGVRGFQKMFKNSVVHIVPREEHFPILSSGEHVGKTVHAWARTLPRYGSSEESGE